jgi:hypothetical protein
MATTNENEMKSSDGAVVRFRLWPGNLIAIDTTKEYLRCTQQQQHIQS